jgi:hypothetical protein
MLNQNQKQKPRSYLLYPLIIPRGIRPRILSRVIKPAEDKQTQTTERVITSINPEYF